MPAHTDSQINIALATYALNQENATRTVSELQAQHGIDVDRRTLTTWARDTYPDRYALARETAHRQLGANIEHAAHRAVGVAGQLLDDLENGGLDQLKPADKAAAFRNVTTGVGILIDKGSALQGRATAITEHRDASQILRGLAFQLGVKDVDGTAEEVAPDQLESGEAA